MCVDLEDMSAISMFGESGIVVQASAKAGTVSFRTEKSIPTQLRSMRSYFWMVALQW